MHGFRLGLLQFGLLLMRLALGVIFMAHGCQKVFGLWGGPGLTPFVQHITDTMGYPAYMGYLAAFTELLGGLAVFVGLLTRLAALGLAGVMAVAAYKVHWVNGFFMNFDIANAPDAGHGIEYNVALFALSLGLFFTGPGRLSLDAKFFCRSCREEEPAVSGEEDVENIPGSPS